MTGTSGVSYVDPSTGRTYPLGEARWRADNGHYLNLGPAPGLGRDDIDPGRDSVWRYAKALLVDPDDAVSMGEGWTPLVAGVWAGAPVLFKLEFLMPTGSFKDRGMPVERRGAGKTQARDGVALPIDALLGAGQALVVAEPARRRGLVGHQDVESRPGSSR